MKPKILTTVKPDTAELFFPGDTRKYLLYLYEEINQITTSLDQSKMLPEMLGLMINVVRGNSGIVYLLDPESKELVITTVVGENSAQNLIGQRIQQKQGIVGDAVFEQKPIQVEQLSEDPRWLFKMNPTLVENWQRAITFPLVLGEKVIGAIQIFNQTRLDLELLTVLANRLAIEIDRIAVIENTRRSNARLKSLLEVIGKIGGTLDKSQLLHLVTEHTAKLINVGRSSIFLVDSNTDHITQHVSYQKPNAAEAVTVPSYSEIIRNAKTAKRNVDDTKPTNLGSKTDTKQSATVMTKSAMTIPLQSGDIYLGQKKGKPDHVLGGLVVMNKEKAAFTEEDGQLLEILADQTSTFLQVSELYKDANDLFMDVIKALVTSIDAKDPYTQGHSLRVSELSVAIASSMGLGKAFVNDLLIGSLLHDVGKIGIPDFILTKPGRLTEEEYDTIKSHPTIGRSIMKKVRMLKNCIPAIEQHHERLDGSGYPFGLQGDHISLMGKIVAVADVFDAMTTDRPYRKAYTQVDVIQYLYKSRGTLFDPKCVEALLKIYQRGELPAI